MGKPDITNHHALRIAVDIGGTFTDGVALWNVDSKIWVGKTLTTPDDPGIAVSTVIADLMRQVGETLGIETPELAEVVHGTTLVTNTLIERKGVRTFLVTTTGNRDALEIGREWRYDLYDLELSIPQPLVGPAERIEVDARMNAAGKETTPVSREDVDRVVKGIRESGAASVAVSFLHSYINPEHEREMARQIQERLPDIPVSCSSELASEIKEFERTSTVAANAYVKPIVAAYLRELQSRIGQIRPNIPLRIMVSSGGFTSGAAASHNPILLLESGPAAGVLSAINTGAAQNISRLLAFDMGGTTAKACVVADSKPPIAYSFECARVHRFKRGSGLPILIPSIDLIEIGAGGGSIASLNSMQLLNVGPQSASSVPGPVCYGLGGTDITVTDADLALGYLNPANFLGGEMQLRRDLTYRELDKLAAALGMEAVQVAWGIYNMVNENMANAARIHIAEKGFDPRSFTMVATGGAGPVHAAEVARKLRIPRLLASIAAGAGSCLGMLAAPARADRSWSQPALLTDVDWPEIDKRMRYAMGDAEEELRQAGAEISAVEWVIGAEMRYAGQGDNVPVSIPYQPLTAETAAAILAAFEKEYLSLYAHLVPGARPQVLTWRLTGRTRTEAQTFNWAESRSVSQAHKGQREIFLSLRQQFAPVDVYERYALPPGTRLAGPLILEERESTIVVPFAAEVEILPDLTVSILLKEFE